MNLSFKYDNYQDVRHNLFIYSVPFLLISGFFVYFRVLPPIHQQVIMTSIEHLTKNEIWKGVWGAGLGVAIFSCIAFLLTEIIQIHDKYYDRYIIKWRRQYAIDFIIPALVQPFASALNYRFYRIAETNIKDFQEQLYYPFVGDRDMKIPKNKVVRFYEDVTVYWLTQINEIILFSLFSLIFFYRITGPSDLEFYSRLLDDFIIVTISFLLNRLWVRSCLAKVRESTTEEIRAIHADKDLTADLQNRLVKLCADYSIPYREAQND
jgi:hypothetical protein